MENKKRSLIKALTWRLLGLIDLFIEVYILASLVKDLLQLAILIPVAHFTTRFIEYYIHERIWTRIKWGYLSET